MEVYRMRNRITWKEKYLLALSEKLTLKEIMLLRDCGMPKARSIRQDAIEYCLINNIQTEMKKIPTEAVFSVTGCDLNYYYDKMKKELMVTTLEIGGER